MNPDGSGLRQITNHAASDAQPNWSPDGTTIAFGSDRDGNSEIYIMNAYGSALTRITDNPAEDSDPPGNPPNSPALSPPPVPCSLFLVPSSLFPVPCSPTSRYGRTPFALGAVDRCKLSPWTPKSSTLGRPTVSA